MTHAAARTVLAIFAIATFLPGASAQQVQYSHGEPTALEQKMLELINRARMNPTQEGVLLDGVNTAYSRDARTRKPSFFANLRGEFASYPAVPPLAFNNKLIQASRAHSQDMLTRNFFAHVNPSGQDPTARGAAVGYDSGVGENIDGAGATTGDEVLQGHYGFMVDYDNIDTSHPLGHRLNVLDSSYTEVGVGMAGSYSPGRITQDFGGPARAYILGVAYGDANGNGAYDPGEGRAGITVRPDIGNYFTVTSTSGGFAIPIDPVQTVTDNVSLPFAVRGGSYSAVQPYDQAYRQQQMQAAPNLTVTLTWSGGSLTSPITTTATIKRPVQRNYRLTGTDGWYYTMSMVTTQNVKADFTAISAPVTPPPGPASTIARDVNADNIPDIIFQNASGQIVSWLMDGRGATTGVKWISTGGLGDWKIVGFLDVSGDTYPDIIFQNNAGQIVAWLMDGRGAVSGVKWISTGGLGDWRVVGFLDVSGDNIPDIIFQNSVGQVVSWIMDGRGAATGVKWISAAGLGDWRVVGFLDVSGDAIPDIIFQNGIGQVVSWIMDGRGTATGVKWISSGGLGDWRVVGFMDVSGDSVPDIIFQNNIGQVVSWIMDGHGAATGVKWISAAGLGDWKVR